MTNPKPQNDKQTPDAATDAGQRRAERLAAQLRANLARRKQQARARRDGEADERPDGLTPKGPAGPGGDED